MSLHTVHTYIHTLVRTSFMISTLVWLSPFLYSSGQSSSRMRGFSIRRRILEWVTSYTYIHTYAKQTTTLKQYTIIMNTIDIRGLESIPEHIPYVRIYIHKHALLTLLNITPSNTQQSDNC